MTEILAIAEVPILLLGVFLLSQFIWTRVQMWQLREREVAKDVEEYQTMRNIRELSEFMDTWYGKS